MDKLELRARARAAARASGLFELDGETPEKPRTAPRSRTHAARGRAAAALPVDTIDETQARTACKPMGELETIVHAIDESGGVRLLYVIVPNPALATEYERLGFVIEAGCRVLLDAAALKPLAMLRVTAVPAEAPPRRHPSTGFNPYFDLPSA